MSSEKEAGGCAACAEQLPESVLLDRLEEVLREYRGQPGALIPVLQLAQGMFGYLPEAALKRISQALDKPYSEAAGVVGLYAFFATTPRGKHLIRVCLGTACYVRGGLLVLEALKRRLNVEVGGTTADRLFSLEVARCFGACGLAPTIALDDDVYKRVKPTRVAEIIDRYYQPAEPAAAQGGRRRAAPAAGRSAAALRAGKGLARAPVPFIKTAAYRKEPDMKPRTAREVMTAPVVTITKDRRMTEAMSLLLRWHVSGLPVVDEEGRLLGIISEHDLINFALDGHAGGHRQLFPVQAPAAGSDRRARPDRRDHQPTRHPPGTGAPVRRGMRRRSTVRNAGSSHGHQASHTSAV